MSLFEASTLEVGSVLVSTTQDKGHDPEFWAKAAADRIVSVGGNCHPLIAQQAEAFKEDVLKQISYYMKEAIKSDRTTVYNAIKDSGNLELAELIRRL